MPKYYQPCLLVQSFDKCDKRATIFAACREDSKYLFGFLLGHQKGDVCIELKSSMSRSLYLSGEQDDIDPDGVCCEPGSYVVRPIRPIGVNPMCYKITAEQFEKAFTVLPADADVQPVAFVEVDVDV